jgi:very-short-patch-repair endonuclease
VLIREGIPLRKRNTVGLNKCSEETKQKLRIMFSGINGPGHRSKLTPERLAEIRERLIRVRPKQVSPETGRKISKTRIERGLSKGDKNPMSKKENVMKWAASNNLSPNKKESHLEQLINAVIPGIYEINVQAKVIVGKKIPDFISTEKSKIIELYGDYWHKGEDPQQKIDYYKRYNFSTLVIWESELKNPPDVIDKIIKFTNE